MNNKLGIFVFLCVFGLTTSCSTNTKTMSTKNTLPADTVEAAGIIYKEAFVNKAGRKIDGVYTVYFKHGDKTYFIKECECNLSGATLQNYMGMQVRARVSFRNGLWDDCDGNRNVQSRIGEYVAIFSPEITGDLNTYSYADGSANVYKLTSDTLEYIPVKKENSSTGMYSGGEPAKVAVSKEQFDEIATLMKAIVQDKSIHIENRNKMTGMISVSYGEESEVTLFRNGDRMALLENALKSVLKK